MNIELISRNATAQMRGKTPNKSKTLWIIMDISSLEEPNPILSGLRILQLIRYPP